MAVSRHRGHRLLIVVFLWCAGLATVVPAGVDAAPGAREPHFFFAQITDTHWGAGDTVALTRTAVAMMNRLPVKLEFVVHTGDMLADRIGDERTVREGLDAMKSIKAPVYYVPGNHDILAVDAERTAKLFTQYFGPVNGRLEVKGVVCLFVCTESLDGDTRNLGRIQREWVEGQLKGMGGRPVLMFMHKPPVRDMLTEGSPSDWQKDDYHPQWKRLFDEHPEIKAVVAGHLHRDELHWIGSVPIHVASSLAPFWDRQPSFRLYEYRNGRLGYWTIYLNRTVSKKRPAK